VVKDKRVKRFMERLYCDLCEDEMKIVDEFRFCIVPEYRYKCGSCDNQELRGIKYPRIIEKEVD